MSASLVIRSRRVLTAGGLVPAAVHVAAGRIERIAPFAEVPPGADVDDAGELVVMPGLVDTHVHVNEPGRTEWEGFETATAAAAAGGITTLIDMPLNSVPATTTVAGLAAKRRSAEGRVHVNVGFWGGVVPGNTSELEGLARAGVRGFKAFLVPSGVDEFPSAAEHDLNAALPVLAALGLPLLVHAESPGEIDAAAATSRSDPRAYAAWLGSRPASAEVHAIDMLIRLSRRHRARIHVVHLSAAVALPLIRGARAEGLPLTVETCPHYLTFAAEEIADEATVLKCAPPIRERSNREALRRAVRDGDIDLIATDHSPCPPAMKCQATGDFFRAWGGIASLELSLAASWTSLGGAGVSIAQLAELMCAAPARLAGLVGRKGTLAAGADADVTVWDPDSSATVDAAKLAQRHKLTPYDSRHLRGIVHRTYVGGRLVFSAAAPSVFPGRHGRLIAA